MASGNVTLALKHHVLNGRLSEAKKVLASAQLSLEDCQDEDGNTPLHWCAQGLETETERREATDQETLAFLLQNGAPKNRQNALGETPLLLAVRLATLDPARSQGLVEDLVKKGNVDPCRADLQGETPLMEAAAADLEVIGRLLLEGRANPLAKSTSGLTAAKLAAESGNEAFVKLLKSPLAERAAKEARAEEADGKSTQEREVASEFQRDRQAKKFDQTLFGQKMNPGLARDKDAPGKPYPEYGTLHDID
mmetsp:Transcript_47253/g.119675  ORF Transcript_47253/g.119675 Transcript_47253/m.119675 type:complete len:251 (+) Transcript_47253:77-829(+)|eukprot:CAMPEP_0183393016 /NCGR_PEP_ID=MMETSP0370-20130417/7648_1 /TAXON_ID=268820 /ORGANISM="Peridinium aciculiferum, Strain PAER-2" /LENGTH=250 /DNA_ID=CAMNT_0025573143 /DNA_START=85 /DNA_END=837 /DNA_ORIENTATION=-